MERHLSSAGTSASVRLREVSVFWDVRFKEVLLYVKNDEGTYCAALET